MNHIDVARTGIGKEGIEGFAVALFGPVIQYVAASS